MSRQFADVPSGVAHTTGPEPTLLHVHAPRGPATGPRRLVALPPDRASPELVLLEPAPGAVGSPAGRLLVSPGAFRRLAGPAAGPGRGAVPFAAAGAQFDVCPDEGVPRFAILVPPADWPAFALPGGLPLRLDPAPGLPVAARVDIRLAGDPAAARALPCDETLKRAFLAAHAGATMRLDRPLTFACQGIALQAAIQRIAWAGSPDLARPAGLLPMDSHAAAQCLRFLAPGSPRPSPGRWLLVDRPHAGPGAEHGPCLEARPMPPGVAVAPGRAIVSPDTYQHLRGGLPGRGDVFLTWGDRALMIAPGPWPGGRLPAGQVALSPDSWDRLFDGQCFRRVGLSASLPRVALVEVHLAQGVPGLMFASHPGLVAAFVQMLDRSVLSQGQELDLPVQDTTLRARLVHLAGADLRPLGSGLLDMHHARAFIYMSAPGDDFPVLDRPASVLLRAPLLAGDLRLPVVFGRDPGRPDRKCVMVPAETLHALQAHCLEDDPALRVNRDYLVLPHDLAPHPPHILAARGVFPADGSAMVLSCTQLPEVLTATCQVATGGHAPGPEDAELLASLLPGALPRSGVIQTHQRYTVAPGPDRPTAELVATWLTDEAGAPCEAGVLVAGLTRVHVPTAGRRAGPGPGPAPAPAPDLTLARGPGHMLSLRVEFIATPTPLYPGLLLPREAFQSLGESLDDTPHGSGPLAHLFFRCRGRLFVARLADAHHTPGVLRMCRDLRAHMYARTGVAPPPLRVDPPPGPLRTVYMRLGMGPGPGGPAGRPSPDRGLSPGRAEAEADLAAAFPDGSMALLERRTGPGREPLTFMPELLLDADGQAVPCGLFDPGITRVHFVPRHTDGGLNVPARPAGAPPPSPPSEHR